MLPISQWDWAGLWSHFFLPILIIAAVIGAVLLVVFAWQYLYPESSANRQYRAVERWREQNHL